MKRWLPALAVLLAAPPNAIAAGVDLTWNDCVGAGAYSQDRVFACTSPTTQQSMLFVQFKSPISVPNFVRATAVLQWVTASPAPLAPYWHYESGGCNESSVTISDYSSSCSSAGFLGVGGPNGDDATSTLSYVPDFPSNGQGRFVLVLERAGAVPVAAGDNYYLFHLTFSTANRATCAGCSERGCARLDGVTLESNDGSPALQLSGADKFSNGVTWNGGDPFPFCLDDLDTETTTWGRIKALFR